MKKLLLITASPTVGGNGDALIAAAQEKAAETEVEITSIRLREKEIKFCKACYGCAKTGACVQKDDFAGILQQIHAADAILVEAPVYYNCMAAQMLTLINRLCCTFACKNYQLGPQKRIGIMMTCTGSDVEEMKHHVHNITVLPSISRAISASRTEIFTDCTDRDTCGNTMEYLARARSLGAWVMNAQDGEAQ